MASAPSWPLDLAASSTEMDPITEQRLAEFRSRRQGLRLWRGASLALGFSVGGLLICLLAESLSEQAWVHWICALVTYGILLSAVICLIVIPLCKSTSLSADARRLERLEPRLKDSLLSAIELSDDASITNGTSAEFRAELQRQVADTMEMVDVRNLLPWQLIRRPLRIGAGAAALLLLLCCVPQLHLPHRIARTLLPFANLGRATNLVIHIERPAPPNQHLPRGDVVAITARISGGQPNRVWLERRDEHGSQRQEMLPLKTRSREPSRRSDAWWSPDESRFESTCPADAPRLEYRVLADGAASPWYELRTDVRPGVDQFELAVSPPSYTGLPTEIFTQEHGSIQALRGSHLRLAIRVNQQLARAEIRWQDSESDSSTQDLQWDADSEQYVTDVELGDSRKYRLLLQSAETGFTNAFSPSYQITALADNPPQIQWLDPIDSSIIAASHELLSMTVIASDDMPLNSLQLQSRQSEADPWEDVGPPKHLDSTAHDDTSPRGSEMDGEAKSAEKSPITGGHRVQQACTFTYDLQTSELQSGDTIQFRVRAQALNEEYAASTPLNLTISSLSLDLTASQAEVHRAEVAARLQRMSTELQSKFPSADGADSALPAAELQEWTARWKAGAEDLLLAAQIAASSCDEWVDNWEMRQIAELTTQWIHLADQISLGEEIAEDRLRAQSQTIAVTAEHARAMVAHDFAERHARLMHTLAGAMVAMTEDTSADVERLMRRQAALGKQLEDVLASLSAYSAHLHPAAHSAMRQLAERLTGLQERMESPTISTQAETLRELARSYAKQLQDASLLSRLDAKLSERIGQAHRFLDQNVQLSARLVADQVRASDSADSANLPPTQYASRFEPVLIQMSQRRSIRRLGPPGSPFESSMLGYARRGMQAILQSSDSVRQKQQALLSLADALLVIELGGELRQALTMTEDLLERESWSFRNTATWTEVPRIWAATRARLEQALQICQLAELDSELKSQMRAAGHDQLADEISTLLQSRLSEYGASMPAVDQLGRKLAQLKELERALAPMLREAHNAILAATPNLATLAHRAAEDARSVQEQSNGLQELIGRGESLDPTSRLQQVLHQTELATATSDSLHNALVDVADSRELLDFAQIEQLRVAQAAITLVDSAREKLATSRELVSDASSAAARIAVVPDAANSARQPLAEAVDLQAQAANTLHRLAELLASAGSTDTSELDAEMRLLEQLMAMSDEPEFEQAGSEHTAPPASEEQIQRAESLAELASQDPKQLLSSLEEELKTNSPMREEMSDIARTAAEQALRQLQDAARRQARIRPELEQSDVALKTQVRLLLHDLQALRDFSKQDLDLLFSEARWTAGAARQTGLQERLREFETHFAAELAILSDIGMHLSATELQQYADALQTSLNGAVAISQAASDQLQSSVEQTIHPNGAEWNHRRREMRDRDRRIHQQDLRHLHQALQREQKQRNQASDELKQTEQQWEAARKMLSAQQAKTGQPAELRDDLPTSTGPITELERRLQAQAKFLQDLEDRRTGMDRLLQQAREYTEPGFRSLNPSAELAMQLIQLAEQRSRLLLERLDVWKEGLPNSVRAPASLFEQAAAQQSFLQAQVSQAAQTLARAGRHESRLEHLAISEQLKQVSDQAARNADRQLQTAADTLARTARRALERDPTQPFSTPEDAKIALDASSEALQAIRQTEDSLRQVLDGSQKRDTSELADSLPGERDGTSVSSSWTESEPGNSPARETSSSAESKLTNRLPLNPEELARLLDVLDRKLHSVSDLGEQDNNAASPAAPQTTSPLSRAARQLAQQMRRSRDEQTPPANQDIGMATQSSMADFTPQQSSGFTILDNWDGVEPKIDAQWADLRLRQADDASQTQTIRMSPRFRQQVEAYFQNLGTSLSEPANRK
ncbi:MAG: hypothetical protein NXI32_01505 [bacterium]|nr:hypothetical protein [bacterium]